MRYARDKPHSLIPIRGVPTVQPRVVCLTARESARTLHLSRAAHIQIFFMGIYVRSSQQVYDVFLCEGIFQCLPSCRCTLLHICLVNFERSILPVVEIAALIAARLFKMECFSLELRALVREVHI